MPWCRHSAFIDLPSTSSIQFQPLALLKKKFYTIERPKIKYSTFDLALRKFSAKMKMVPSYHFSITHSGLDESKVKIFS